MNTKRELEDGWTDDAIRSIHVQIDGEMIEGFLFVWLVERT